MFIPPVFYAQEDTDNSADILLKDFNPSQDQDETSKDSAPSAAVITSNSKRQGWQNKSDLLSLYYKKRQKNKQHDPYDYQLHAAFVISGGRRSF